MIHKTLHLDDQLDFLITLKYYLLAHQLQLKEGIALYRK